MKAPEWCELCKEPLDLYPGEPIAGFVLGRPDGSEVRAGIAHVMCLEMFRERLEKARAAEVEG